ncbi:MAG TPA: serine/threonine-protein kinase [Vicinamibacterales bacterium]|nr:serine/threonine-protein kinase [Vicinamibacterales bacterium]
MSRSLDDATLNHLRDVAEWPDLGERYEVCGRLGRGGMGAVYEVHDRTLDRRVAVKVLDATGYAPDSADRLLREAQLLARLEHPGIVPVHDAGTLADGRVFYAMKLVRGERLTDRLQREMSGPERADRMLRICDAIAFAHARGVVHGDIKPENIMVGSFGEVLVMDWGVAALLDPEKSAERVIAGTPGFMPPEQAEGARIDARADVYSLGALLAAVMPKPLPRPLAAIVQRACAPLAENRYASVAELARDIAAFRDGDRVAAHRETLADRAARLYSRYRVPATLVVAYMVIRVALLLWFRR